MCNLALKSSTFLLVKAITTILSLGNSLCFSLTLSTRVVVLPEPAQLTINVLSEVKVWSSRVEPVQ